MVLLPGGLLLSAPAWAEDLVEAAKQVSSFLYLYLSTIDVETRR